MLLEGILTALAWMALIALWLFAAWRVGRHDVLHRQARVGLAFAILICPLLAFGYWLPRITGHPPFWLRPDNNQDQAV